jgi:hypothetical protein
VNEQDATRDPESTSGPVDRYSVGVHTLRVPNHSVRLEHRLYLAGILLAFVGLVVIGLGWWGASGTKFVYQEIPYVISGGIFGLALVFIGAALFARYSVARLLRFWLARLVTEEQLQTDRVIEAIDRVAESLTAHAAALDRLGNPRDSERPPPGSPPN